MAEVDYQVERVLKVKQGSVEYYELQVDHGYADVTFETSVGWFGIANLYVEPKFRKGGRAKALLGHAALMAEEFNASLVYASIISRESIDAFVAVFGEEAVSIEKQGQYNGLGEASAFLRVSNY